MRSLFRVLSTLAAIAVLSIPVFNLLSGAQTSAASAGDPAKQIRSLKITVLSTMLVGDNSRPLPDREGNRMIAIRKDYEATGGKIIEHDGWAEIFPGNGSLAPCRASTPSATGA